MPKTDEFISRESKNGEFSPKIPKDLNTKINYVCWALGANKSKWVINVLNKAVDEESQKIKSAVQGTINEQQK